MGKETWVPIKGYKKYRASTKGRIAKVVCKNCGTLKILKLSINNNRYFVSLKSNKSKKKQTIARSILIAIAFHNHIPCGMKIVVDHKDENPLNDRPKNLQLITTRENVSRSKKNKTSKYTGVSLAPNGKWKASIRINRKTKNLGYFIKEKDAAKAYKKALKKITNGKF
jgi:hypothetical protein